MIRIEELTKYYGKICALDRISLTIHKGEILGLLGPNGAGKTTTLRILTCYLNPTSGQVRVKGFNIQEHPLEIKKLIGYLPEAAPVYPDMLTFDYLNFVAEIRGLEGGKKMSRIKELAALCDLSTVMHKPIHELSKGYKQRVGLAHAMMNDPEILILDEPTTGLDPNQIVEIRDIIREIGKKKTIILSTHILSEAEVTCDRIVIIHKGKIAADRPTEALKEEAGEKYTINLSLQNCEPLEVKETLTALPGVASVAFSAKRNGNTNLAITCDGGRDIRPIVYQAIRERDWLLLDFHREARTLETIFRELTKEV